MFTDAQIHAFTKKLEVSKRDLEKELATLQEKPEFGSDVDHFEEEADEAEEFSKNLGVAKVLRHRLKDVEDALGKIRKNAYGVCEQCHREIEIEILTIDPESRYCKSCKQIKNQ